ncbi:hypothetical protein DERP_004527 [Dermatophagoides pteronyssinus]|uniref:Uncharacterized protein n=1 Tax=Dermatophagoides pteronyssinus TaxID=6956 RepID=A0ABQ8JPS3_DERPT|nr:hypothetical protein DERP_004527 [Dermatophagoides pteronyssinus]
MDKKFNQLNYLLKSKTISASFTVGLALANDFNISDIDTTGSRSLSPGTSVHDIFIAPDSSGRHGVNRT